MFTIDESFPPEDDGPIKGPLSDRVREGVKRAIGHLRRFPVGDTIITDFSVFLTNESKHSTLIRAPWYLGSVHTAEEVDRAHQIRLAKHPYSYLPESFVYGNGAFLHKHVGKKPLLNRWVVSARYLLVRPQITNKVVTTFQGYPLCLADLSDGSGETIHGVFSARTTGYTEVNPGRPLEVVEVYPLATEQRNALIQSFGELPYALVGSYAYERDDGRETPDEPRITHPDYTLALTR